MKSFSRNMINSLVPSVSAEAIIRDSLRVIDNNYKDLIVPNAMNQKFSENKWLLSNGNDKRVPLDFASYEFSDDSLLSDNSNYGLQLFLKVRTFHLINSESRNTAQPFAPKTIQRNLSHVRRVLLPFFKRHGILQFGRVSGNFRSINNLTPSLFDLLINEVLHSKLKKNSKIGILDALAKYLSEDLRIPTSLRPAFNLFGNASPSSLAESLKDDTEGFEPIPDEDFYWIGKSALEFVSSYAEVIIKLHEIVIEVYKTVPPHEIVAAFDRSQVFNEVERRHRHVALAWRVPEIIRRMRDSGIKLPMFSEEHRQYWATENIIMPASDADVSEIENSGFTTTYLIYLFKLLFGALCSIILIPTGMRNSELRLLDIKRLSVSPNRDGIFSYVNSIMKFKPNGMFYLPNEIPIPVETWRAIKILDRFTAPLRNKNSSIVCVAPWNASYGRTCSVDKYGTIQRLTQRLIKHDTTNLGIAAFCRFIRSQTIPTTHRFRKSVAEFMLRQTKLAPILLCQLFGHRDVQMTLRYLRKNKLIQNEMRQYNAERFKDGAVVMAIAFAKGAVGGPMVKRIRDSIMTMDEYQGLTEPEIAVAFGQYLMQRITNGQLVILHTPLNLCCRTISAKDTLPCQSNAPDVYDLGLPDPSNCAGVKCDWALVTYENVEDIGASIVFFKNMIDSINQSMTRHASFLAHAVDFVETYDPIVDRIKIVPIEDLRMLAEKLRGKIVERVHD